uniref:Uncharacterized protein n=1 Tax=Ciona savignyi TaxID=51511 RepID=H2ZP17_CIOSA
MNCIMSTLRRRDQQIVTALQQQFVELVSTLITTELFCENGACKHCEQFQRKFFETLLSRLHDLDRNMTSIIFHLCVNDSTCKDVVCYIADLMVQRIEPYCRKNILISNSEKMAVLQFLFCLILGCKKEQLFTKPIDHDAVINTISTFKLTKQAAVSVHACDVLFNFCDSDPNVVELFHILLTTSVFSNTKSLNALAWVGLFQVGKTFRSEWLTGLESEFGLLASECIKANMNQPNEGIIMIELCTDLLCTSSSIFHHCLLNLFEDQSHIACLTNLLQSPKLHKSFHQFRELIADYIDSLKVNSSNEQDIQRLKVTSLSLNFCTNK